MNVRNNRQKPETIVIAIAGNKCDLIEQVQVEKKEAEQYAKTVNAIFEQTSAKENKGIEEIFQKIQEKLENSNLKLQSNNPYPPVKQIKSDPHKSTPKESCY